MNSEQIENLKDKMKEQGIPDKMISQATIGLTLGVSPDKIVRSIADSYSNPAIPNQLEPFGTSIKTIISNMLRENTGTHILDSGGAYDRNWERNQSKVFDKEPVLSVTIGKKHDTGKDGKGWEWKGEYEIEGCSG